MPENLVACPDRDLLQRPPSLPSGGATCRVRRGRNLATVGPRSLDRTLAPTGAAAIAFLLANAFPPTALSAAHGRAPARLGADVAEAIRTMEGGRSR